MACYTARMNTPLPPNHYNNCERWSADAALMTWLEQTAKATLKMVGDTTDINSMLRAQGMYKGIEELITNIKGGAMNAEAARNSLRRAAGIPASI